MPRPSRLLIFSRTSKDDFDIFRKVPVVIWNHQSWQDQKGKTVFEGFSLDMIETPEVTLRVRHAGSGPPLLLLHGHPQTHAMWHLVAPRLAEEFTVVCPDLRGYGDSSKPETTPDHEPYSKRAMARDQIALMQQLGFEQFAVAGHDRGARVAYRMALDHPDAVSKLAVLDIIPTGEHFRRADFSFAMGYYHWFFLAQPADIPERLIGADPDFYYLTRRSFHNTVFAPEALADYQRCWNNPATIHAMCEDYRAGATYDYSLDEEDRQAGRRIACPLLALWGAKGPVGNWYDILDVWRDWADDVRGRGIESGHFIAEEKPEDTFSEFLAFFRE
jgi:haloacetate dehalogenase